MWGNFLGRVNGAHSLWVFENRRPGWFGGHISFYEGAREKLCGLVFLWFNPMRLFCVTRCNPPLFFFSPRVFPYISPFVCSPVTPLPFVGPPGHFLKGGLILKNHWVVSPHKPNGGCRRRIPQHGFFRRENRFFGNFT